jgi:hypothetical protein
MSSEDLTGVIFGMGVLVLGTIILVVVLMLAGRLFSVRAQRADDNRFAELAERYETLATRISDGQDAGASDLAEIRTRVGEIERLLRDVG